MEIYSDYCPPPLYILVFHKIMDEQMGYDYYGNVLSSMLETQIRCGSSWKKNREINQNTAGVNASLKYMHSTCLNPSGLSYKSSCVWLIWTLVGNIYFYRQNSAFIPDTLDAWRVIHILPWTAADVNLIYNVYETSYCMRSKGGHIMVTRCTSKFNLIPWGQGYSEKNLC